MGKDLLLAVFITENVKQGHQYLPTGPRGVKGEGGLDAKLPFMPSPLFSKREDPVLI